MNILFFLVGPAGSRPALMAVNADKQPYILPYLDNLNLPYVDDSNAATPTSDLDLRRRLSSTTSSKASTHGIRGPDYNDLASFANFKRQKEPTHFQFGTPQSRKTQPLLPQVVVDRTKSDENDSSSGEEATPIGRDHEKGKLFADNPFICRTPSTTMVDMKGLN